VRDGVAAEEREELVARTGRRWDRDRRVDQRSAHPVFDQQVCQAEETESFGCRDRVIAAIGDGDVLPVNCDLQGAGDDHQSWCHRGTADRDPAITLLGDRRTRVEQLLRMGSESRHEKGRRI
jgi:hypothetical protein